MQCEKETMDEVLCNKLFKLLGNIFRSLSYWTFSSNRVPKVGQRKFLPILQGPDANAADRDGVQFPADGDDYFLMLY